jgi:hypothetical protein
LAISWHLRAGLGVVFASLLLSVACSTQNQAGASASPSPSPTLLTLGKLTVSQDVCSLDAVAPFASGGITFLAINKSNVSTFFHVFRLADGHTFSEVLAHVEEERRLADAGAPSLGPPGYLSWWANILLKPGETSTPEVIFARGTYVIVCTEGAPGVQELRVIGAAGPLVVK